MEISRSIVTNPYFPRFNPFRSGSYYENYYIVYYTRRFSRKSEAFASEFLEDLAEIFNRCYMHSDVCSSLTTRYLVSNTFRSHTLRERKCTLSINAHNHYI